MVSEPTKDRIGLSELDDFKLCGWFQFPGAVKAMKKNFNKLTSLLLILPCSG